MLITEKEVQIWNENKIEYVRLQVDNTNQWNVKRTNQDLIKAICNIRQTRKVKISNYLTEYLNVIVQTMTT
jgi:t-SNARE complex subunit (syntaxin)